MSRDKPTGTDPNIASAHYRKGIALIRGDGVDRDAFQARQSLGQAADAGHTAARVALARLCLRAQGGPHDPTRAIELLTGAARSGHSDAQFQLAGLSLSGFSTRPDAATCRQWLASAAARDHPLACAQLAYSFQHGLGGEKDRVEAMRWYGAAARNGDAGAMLHLASAHASAAEGNSPAVASPGAHRAAAWALARRAAIHGYPGAAGDANRYKAASSPAEQAMAGKFDQGETPPEPILPAADESATPPAPENLSEAPRVRLFDSVLDVHQCRHLIHRAAPLIRPSRILSRATGETVRSEARSSGGMSFIAPLIDLVIWHVNEQLASLAGMPVGNGEPLHMLRYLRGDEYRAHYDWFDPANPRHQGALKNGGQRILTLLVYLNDVADGGETRFVETGLTVPTRRGSVLMFYNCRQDGSPDPDTLHAGVAVREGEKWLATRWVREHARRDPLTADTGDTGAA